MIQMSKPVIKRRRKIFRRRYHSWCWTCPDSSPSISQMSSKRREMKRESFPVCRVWWHQLSANFNQPVRTDKAVPGQRKHFWNHDNTPTFKVTQKETASTRQKAPQITATIKLIMVWSGWANSSPSGRLMSKNLPKHLVLLQLWHLRGT